MTTTTHPIVGHFADGRRLSPTTGRTLPLASPIDGASLGELAVADSAQVDAIVQRAHEAFQKWGRTPVKDRVQPLYRFKALVEKNLRPLAETVSRENGKTVDEAAAGILRGLEVVSMRVRCPR